MRRRRCDRILARIAVAWAFVLAAVPSSADRRAVSGRGAVGEWELVWRISKTEGLTNLFRQVMGEEAEFPVRWRRIVSSRGDRLLFFDRSGEMDSELALSPGQQGIASHDGSAYVLWTEDPIESGMSEFEFYLRDAEEPSWSAKAAGEPLLMARDGAFFVIASLVETSQHFGVLDSRGKVELVGSGGEIRGELPIYPAYASTTGDGERVAFLHDSELIVLGRDGLLDWQRRVPVDHLAPREGMSQVDARAGLIAIGGTGRSASGSGGSTLQPGRRGVIRVFDDEGTLIWKHDQPRSDDLWFQLFPAISPSGDVVATCHATAKELVVRNFEGRSGELVWERASRRQSGFRSLCVNREMTVLAHGDARTSLVAWNRTGDVVWEGVVLLPAKRLRLTDDNLLVSELWILKLTPEGGQS